MEENGWIPLILVGNDWVLLILEGNGWILLSLNGGELQGLYPADRSRASLLVSEKTEG